MSVLAPIGLDHVVAIAADGQAALGNAQSALGRGPCLQTTNADSGAETSLFCFENGGLEILSPKGEGPVAARLYEILAERPNAGFQTLALACADLEVAGKAAAGLGLAPGPIQAGAAADLSSGRPWRWRSLRLDPMRLMGLRVFLLQREGEARPVAPGVGRIDKILLGAPDPDLAAAHLAQCLGLIRSQTFQLEFPGAPKAPILEITEIAPGRTSEITIQSVRVGRAAPGARWKEFSLAGGQVLLPSAE